MLLEMPDGTFANIADGTPPDVIERIKAQHAATPQSRAAAIHGSDEVEHASSQHLADQQMALNAAMPGLQNPLVGGAMGRGVTHGALFNLDDELAGGTSAITRGIWNAVRHGDIGEIPRAYRLERDASREVSRRMHDESPIASTIGELGGSLLNPAGAGGDVLRFGSRAVPWLGRAAEFVEAGPIRQAVATGFNQGAINGFGASEGDPLSGIANGAILGAGFGGVLGGAAHGIRRGIQTIRDARPENASRAAYTRIANLLNNAKMTPDAAEAELAATAAGGGRPMVADLTPGTQAIAARSARRAEMPGADELRTASLLRTADRPEVLQNQVAGHFEDVPTGTDAIAAEAANTGARKAHGNANYGDVLDRNMVWNDDLEKFFRKDNPYVQDALKSAVRHMRGQDLDPTQLGFHFNAAGDIEYVKVPNMHVFDYIKRGFDDRIGEALRAGKADDARVFSGQLTQLKEGISRSNPEYGQVLAGQRDFYQKQAALDLGKNIVSRLTGTRTDPRVLLNELKAVKPEDLDHVRTAFADAVVNLRDAGGTGRGVTVLRDMMSAPNKRKVLETLFDGKGNLGRFERWLNREVRSSVTDAKISGPQSITGDVMLASEGAQANPFAEVATAGLRGYGFGGAPGMISNTLAAINKIRPTERGPGFEAMAKLLMSDGTGLAAGLHGAKQHDMMRRALNIIRARQFAKVGQQPFTDLAGEQQ